MGKHSNIAIIPARGGSKRIKNKNIKLFNGKPIIAYPIAEIQKSGLFSRVIVSTDSREIADVSEKLGAEVPFTRPDNISDDHSTLAKVVEHALDWYKKKGETFAYACCTLATAPFVEAEQIKAGYDLITQRKVGSVISVARHGFPVLRSFTINTEGFLQMQWPDHELARSNDLPDFYHDAGQFYWLDVPLFLKKKKIFSRDALPIILPRHMVQDIDTIEDWERAELLCKVKQMERS